MPRKARTKIVNYDKAKRRRAYLAAKARQTPEEIEARKQKLKLYRAQRLKRGCPEPQKGQYDPEGTIYDDLDEDELQEFSLNLIPEAEDHLNYEKASEFSDEDQKRGIGESLDEWVDRVALIKRRELNWMASTSKNPSHRKRRDVIDRPPATEEEINMDPVKFAEVIAQERKERSKRRFKAAQQLRRQKERLDAERMYKDGLENGQLPPPLFKKRRKKQKKKAETPEEREIRLKRGREKNRQMYLRRLKNPEQFQKYLEEKRVRARSDRKKRDPETRASKLEKTRLQNQQRRLMEDKELALADQLLQVQKQDSAHQLPGIISAIQTPDTKEAIEYWKAYSYSKIVPPTEETNRVRDWRNLAFDLTKASSSKGINEEAKNARYFILLETCTVIKEYYAWKKAKQKEWQQANKEKLAAYAAMKQKERSAQRTAEEKKLWHRACYLRTRAKLQGIPVEPMQKGRKRKGSEVSKIEVLTKQVQMLEEAVSWNRLTRNCVSRSAEYTVKPPAPVPSRSKAVPVSKPQKAVPVSKPQKAVAVSKPQKAVPVSKPQRSRRKSKPPSTLVNRDFVTDYNCNNDPSGSIYYGGDDSGSVIDQNDPDYDPDDQWEPNAAGFESLIQTWMHPKTGGGFHGPNSNFDNYNSNQNNIHPGVNVDPSAAAAASHLLQNMHQHHPSQLLHNYNQIPPHFLSQTNNNFAHGTNFQPQQHQSLQNQWSQNDYTHGQSVSSTSAESAINYSLQYLPNSQLSLQSSTPVSSFPLQPCSSHLSKPQESNNPTQEEKVKRSRRPKNDSPCKRRRRKPVPESEAPKKVDKPPVKLIIRPLPPARIVDAIPNDLDKPGLKCPHCPNRFRSRVFLERHITDSHPTEATYDCKICSFKWPTKKRLKCHLWDTHRETRDFLQCPLCELKIRNSRGGLYHHLKKTHPINKDIFILGVSRRPPDPTSTSFYCAHCTCVFQSYKDVANHFTLMHMDMVRQFCKFCGIMLRFSDHLSDHVLRMHPDEWDPSQPLESYRALEDRLLEQDELFKCETCKNTFLTDPYLSQHRKKGHPFLKRLKYECNRCDQHFSNKQVRRFHLARCRIKIRCPWDCKGFFSCDKLLKDHLEQDHPLFSFVPHLIPGGYRRFKCEFCRRSFGSLLSLRSHFHRFHIQKDKPASIIPAALEVSPTSKDSSLNPTESTEVTKVSKSAAKESNVHDPTSTDGREQTNGNAIASTSATATTTTSPLTTIPTTTTNASSILSSLSPTVKPATVAADPIPTVFTCTYCKINYKTAAFLEQHIKVAHPNADQRPRHWCDLCGKSFTKNATMNRHKRQQHSDLKGFPCPHCPQMLSRPEHVRVHVKRVHENPNFDIRLIKRNLPDKRPVNCKYCKKTFKSEFLMTNHVTSFHYIEHSSTFCDVCGKQLRLPYLLGHMRMVHPEHVPDKMVTSERRKKLPMDKILELIAELVEEDEQDSEDEEEDDEPPKTKRQTKCKKISVDGSKLKLKNKRKEVSESSENEDGSLYSPDESSNEDLEVCSEEEEEVPKNDNQKPPRNIPPKLKLTFNTKKPVKGVTLKSKPTKSSIQLQEEDDLLRKLPLVLLERCDNLLPRPYPHKKTARRRGKIVALTPTPPPKKQITVLKGQQRGKRKTSIPLNFQDLSGEQGSSDSSDESFTPKLAAKMLKNKKSKRKVSNTPKKATATSKNRPRLSLSYNKPKDAFSKTSKPPATELFPESTADVKIEIKEEPMTYSDPLDYFAEFSTTPTATTIPDDDNSADVSNNEDDMDQNEPLELEMYPGLTVTVYET